MVNFPQNRLRKFFFILGLYKPRFEKKFKCFFGYVKNSYYNFSVYFNKTFYIPVEWADLAFAIFYDFLCNVPKWSLFSCVKETQIHGLFWHVITNILACNYKSIKMQVNKFSFSLAFNWNGGKHIKEITIKQIFHWHFFLWNFLQTSTVSWSVLFLFGFKGRSRVLKVLCSFKIMWDFCRRWRYAMRAF